MRNKDDDEFLYKTLGCIQNNDLIEFHLPYELPIDLCKRNNKDDIFKLEYVTCIEGQSDFLLNEMQYSRNGRLMLFYLIRNTSIKKPRHFI